MCAVGGWGPLFRTKSFKKKRIFFLTPSLISNVQFSTITFFISSFYVSAFKFTLSIEKPQPKFVPEFVFAFLSIQHGTIYEHCGLFKIFISIQIFLSQWIACNILTTTRLLISSR